MSDYGKVTFQCGGCRKYGMRFLIDKHARVGINCMGCARVVVPASRCAVLIAERRAEAVDVDPLTGSSVDPGEQAEVA